jgi:REP element-mobilizing transposase RayT
MYINKSIRLKDYDYSRTGAYFVTICVKDWRCLFGKVHKEKMKLNELGKIAEKYRLEIPKHFENVELDVFVIMPNHIHGIINIFNDKNETALVGRRYICDLQENTNNKIVDLKYQKLPIIVSTFKAAVTRQINKLYSNVNFKWQPYYYDHIIRNEKERENIQSYILSNPANWKNDIENRSTNKGLTQREKKTTLTEYYKDLFNIKTNQ